MRVRPSSPTSTASTPLRWAARTFAAPGVGAADQLLPWGCSRGSPPFEDVVAARLGARDHVPTRCTRTTFSSLTTSRDSTVDRGRRASAGARPARTVSRVAASSGLLGANTRSSRPQPKSGRITRSPGLVNSNCSIRSRTWSSYRPCAVRPLRSTRNGKAMSVRGRDAGSSASHPLLYDADDRRTPCGASSAVKHRAGGGVSSTGGRPTRIRVAAGPASGPSMHGCGLPPTVCGQPVTTCRGQRRWRRAPPVDARPRDCAARTVARRAVRAVSRSRFRVQHVLRTWAFASPVSVDR